MILAVEHEPQLVLGFWFFVIQLILAVALAVASYFLAPKPRSPQEQDFDQQLPASVEGLPLGVGFGTYEAKGTMIWPRTRNTMPKNKSVSSKGEVRWYLSWATCYGWGPITKIWQERWNDKVEGSLTTTFDGAVHTDGYVQKTQRGGLFRFYFGHDNKVKDAHMVAKVTALETADNQRVPYFRHLAYSVHQGVHVGSSPYVPNASAKLTRQPQCPIDETEAAGLHAADRMIGNDANPIHVLAEFATNTKYGFGIPLDAIDWPSWCDAAATLYGEGLGISGYISELKTFEQLAEEILFHADAAFSRRDDKIYIRVLRKDYTPASVPVIAEADIEDCEYQPADLNQIANMVSVEYTDASKDYQVATFPVSDPGNMLAQDNTRREVLRLPWITNASLARSVAARKAQRVLIPTDAAEITINRNAAAQYEVGDVVRFAADKWGISSTPIWRIMRIERSASNKSFARWIVAEEVGELAHSLTQLPGGGAGGEGGGGGGGGSEWESNPLTFQLPFEPPRALNAAGSLVLSYLANREDGEYTNFRLYHDTGAGWEAVTDEGEFAFAGTGTVTLGTLEIDDVTGIPIATPALDFDWEQLLTTAPSISRAELLNHARLAVLCPNTSAPWTHEIVAFQGIEQTETGYKLTGIVRALYDTARVSGSCAVFILQNGAVPFAAGPRIDWINGQAVTLRAVPYSGGTEATFAEMDNRAITLKNRYARPIAVQSLAVDGNGVDPTYTENVAARLSWLPVNRDNLGGIEDATHTSEAGEDYVVRIYDDQDAQIGADIVVPSSQTFVDAWGVTRLYHDFTVALGSGYTHVQITVNSRIGGLESLDDLNPKSITVEAA